MSTDGAKREALSALKDELDRRGAGGHRHTRRIDPDEGRQAAADALRDLLNSSTSSTDQVARLNPERLIKLAEQKAADDVQKPRDPNAKPRTPGIADWK
ncbi:hypothetical protein GPOL_c29040 [Gordonia polyisoprenivorans VH2]|uniref:Uncharacterized protein n=1 Tax=Gordonia polyisoprenivorans (strain DSM 44266 / VH2) TaxID=1112204 RepID=H6MTP6_GORPV|nr:hypothetical protein [Gordonia polyisoprenivorans]AFA73921.1 hypothetical protein GPOL_c29040 [Gordonia polyisoprenivorans VH2]